MVGRSRRRIVAATGGERATPTALDHRGDVQCSGSETVRADASFEKAFTSLPHARGGIGIGGHSWDLASLQVVPPSIRLPIRTRQYLVRCGSILCAHESMVVGKPVAFVGDVGVAVRNGLAVVVEADEDDLLDRQNAVTGDHVAHLGAHREGGAPERGGAQSHLDQVTLSCGADEVDLGYVLGDRPRVSELDDGVNRGLFIDPAQQAAAEQGAVRVQVLGTDPAA